MKLGVSHLPTSMCDPDVLPAMCPTVKHACETFPRSAEAILSHHGLETSEFNTLQERLNNDMIFQWRVQMKIKSLDQQIKSASSTATTSNNSGSNAATSRK